MTFHQYSKEILTEYLGTVAYVDDLIFPKKVESKALDLKIESPREMAAKTDKETPLIKKDADEKVVGSKTDSPIQQLVPNINPSVFTNAFLDKGIHCSLFEIENDQDPLERLKSILKKSDVVILDWQMHQDDGRKAKELLTSVILSSQQPELRLFVIFTDDKRYKTLLTENILPELKVKGIINAVPENVECVFKFGHSKILVLEKVNGKKSEITVSDEELPDRIIEEFVEITSGLVSNTVLKAVSVLRRNTHSVLATFNKNLDPAYLAHRAMLSTPEDSESLLKNTIVDSFDSLLTYSEINNANNIDQIEKWIDENNLSSIDTTISIGKATQKVDIPVNKENKKKWLRDGWRKLILDQPNNKLIEKDYENFEKGGGPLFLCANKSFIPSGDNSPQDFAILTHHKSNFITPTYIPYLTLGVVIQHANEYYLCIQQKCDSVRIGENETRNFLFLILEHKGSFPILFKTENGDYIVKKAGIKSYHLNIFKFRQTHNGIVEASNFDGVYFFSNLEGLKFKWILDLKESHAQRIANKYASELSRVGLDESEWLRRTNG